VQRDLRSATHHPERWKRFARAAAAMNRCSLTATALGVRQRCLSFLTASMQKKSRF
jgi:hypothetical protein